MEIIINGQQAYLKKNTSFEYISENPLFTGSDSYTLTITFPLKDCPENIRIFGHLNRQDVQKNKVVFDCDIRDKDFFRSGSIVITQISEVEVKTQFLEGRSEQNFDDTFDNVYLNQLNLGYPDADECSPSKNGVDNALAETYPGYNWIPLPWANNTSGNIQNDITEDENGNRKWANTRATLTFQPFLMYILEKICEVTGYKGEFGNIENSDFGKLLICNTLPSTWGAKNFAIALPHWSLTEFFEQLELLMKGEFTINHKAKTISFEFSHQIAAKQKEIRIDKVINKYSVEVAREDISDYIGMKNMAYAENSNRLWAYMDCQWYIDKHKKDAVEYDTLAELLKWAKDHKISGYERHETAHGYSESLTRGYARNSDAQKLLYARDVDTYFIMYCYKSEFMKSNHIEKTDTTYNWYKYYNRLMPVNQFGRLLVDKKADDVELNIVPAWLDDTDPGKGQCLFLECGEMGSAVSWSSENGGEGELSGSQIGGRRARANSGLGNADSQIDEEDYNNGALAQTYAGQAIAHGEQQKGDAYFDKIYVGFWDAEERHPGKYPHPIISNIEIEDDFTMATTPFSLSLRKQVAEEKYIYDIDSKKKYTFSFLSGVIPSPRAVFHIEGSKYICEKITATFHEGSGRSQLLKGVFYKIT